jgi:hypothetical protein
MRKAYSMTSRFVWVLLVAVVATMVFPSSVSASTQIQNTRLVFEIKNVPSIPNVQTIQNLQNPPPPATPPPVVVDPIVINAPILQDYLNKKGSPLAPYAADILKYENWKLVLAISNGESTLCKKQIYNNCWGVGGAWNMRHYASFTEGFADVNRFLTEKYVARGADTPEEIVNRYVGHPNANWVFAVNKILAEVNQLPLQN